MLDQRDNDLEALLENDNLPLIASFLEGKHPTEIAEILTSLPPESVYRILQTQKADFAGDIFTELPPWMQTDTAEFFNDAQLARLIERLSPDVRVDVLRVLPETRVEKLLPIIAKSERENIKQLSQYPEGTAGSIMTTDYIALLHTLTVKEVIERIRLEGANKESIYTIFVIDTQRILKGTVSLADIILADHKRTLDSIKEEQIYSVKALSDREEALYLFSRYDLVTLPVVDNENRLLGIITHDDVIDVLEQERTEDFERFNAITGKHEGVSYLNTSIWSHFKHRVVWLIVLAAMGLISGAVLQTFESTLTSIIILAFYMPMLADTGGNTGSQSATMVVRALALKEIGPKDAIKVLWKELRVSILLGLVLGFLAFLRVLLTGNPSHLPETISLLNIGIAISVALCIQVISATVIGALLPLAAAAVHLDPALIASPALTTIVDITGLFVYFTTARVVLKI
ncbi:MAG: magnesium transporter [Spirochaetia bacterium]|uniref:Magnesium transporter MgtE n=1 Tax=bioreactor metagenome TaxID=1076179 RepID=A0A644TKZ3_9ZZZZ|nr:magnesium transporter [Spirochaetia bacterium]MCE1208035.1 magnesium transporter [Spirochaetia bacterium]MDD3820424.1 magnesium transporter [Spirochaetales bacterium]HAP54532.1 magnesium transporter [Spirochaetaceae bacterium]HOI22336.1 magnesium transporter [Spirochaetales bacterium]